MAIKRLEADMNIIQQLGDHPNLDNEMSAEEVKAKFDEAGNEIKEYLNETVVPAVNALQESSASQAAQVNDLIEEFDAETAARAEADIALQAEIAEADAKFETHKTAANARLTNVESGYVATDSSLTKGNLPANAKAVGDRFNNILSDVSYRCRFSGGKLVDPANSKSAEDLGASLLAAYRSGKNVVIFEEIDKGNGDIEEPYIREFVCAGFRDNREDLILFFCRVEGETVETVNVNCSNGTLSQTVKDIGTYDVYAAEYDPDSVELRSNFFEMVFAFKEGKIVTLSGTDSMGVINTLVCVHYDSEETSAYDGECLMFAFCGATYTRSVYVTADGIVGDSTTYITELKMDVDAIKEDMGDIDAALDAIIAIQNSLIGGDGA